MGRRPEPPTSTLKIVSINPQSFVIGQQVPTAIVGQGFSNDLPQTVVYLIKKTSRVMPEANNIALMPDAVVNSSTSITGTLVMLNYIRLVAVSETPLVSGEYFLKVFVGGRCVTLVDANNKPRTIAVD